MTAGDDLSPVGIHLRYLQTMLKIHRPVEEDMAHIVPMPLEIFRYWVGRRGLNKAATKMKERLRSGVLEIDSTRRRKTKYSLVRVINDQ